MDIDKINQTVDIFRDSVGTGLICCDIWGPDGLSIAGYNPQPKAVALFADITRHVKNALADSAFPPLSRYYVLELSDNKSVCVIMHEEHLLGCLVDRRKVVMGKLINLDLPKALSNLRAALDDND